MICAYIYFYGVTEKRNWNGEYGEYIYLISQSDIGQTEKKNILANVTVTLVDIMVQMWDG